MQHERQRKYHSRRKPEEFALKIDVKRLQQVKVGQSGEGIGPMALPKYATDKCPIGRSSFRNLRFIILDA